MAESESYAIAKEACPECGSSDNVAVYSDGHRHCFSQGCKYHTGPDDSGDFTPQPTARRTVNHEFLHGSARSLSKRGLTEETCKKFGYTVGEYVALGKRDQHRAGEMVQIANYRRDGELVAQKVRFADKDFTVRGDLKGAGLYGQHLWAPTRRIVVTEGEIDCLSVAQVLDLKWPVVSIPNGAQGAKKSIAKELAWLEQFDEVVFMLDTDEPGQKAAQECALLFTPGKAKIAHLSMKDANELLVAGKGPEIVQAIWNAKVFRPDGIVTVSDVRDRALTPTVSGLPWPWPKLTELTYGRRYGEVYGLGAGTGVGKTDVFTTIIEQTAVDLNEKVALFYLESIPAETIKRVAGKLAGKRFHVPDGSWTPEELEAAINKIEATGNVFMYDSFGSAEWETILAKMKYLAHAEDVKHFFLDHLTALAAEADDERIELEKIMAQMAKFAEANEVCVYFITHLATPEGKPHEEGGRVMLRHFKGSRAIGFWTHFAMALERNQQDEDESARHTTTVRILKDRYTGQSTGQTFLLRYDAATGLLHETEADDCPFDVATTSNDF